MSTEAAAQAGGAVEFGERERARAAQRVTLVGAVVNLVLAVGKIVIGTLGQSQALVADGIHTLSDLVSDAVVLVATRHGSREPDPQHPYGHGRIETVATVAVGMLLFGVTAGIVYDAARRLTSPETLLHPGPLALVAALLSVLAKEALTRYTLRVARRIRSALLRANAWHHRSDAISSVVVIIGVAGSMAGLPYLDAVAAIFVALMIAKIAWDLSWGGIRELIDTGLDPEDVTRIRQVILSVHGVRAMHMLRSRRMGADALVDVHILVDPRLSVSEGHQISETVRAKLVRELEDVTDVMVHIDPEDDEVQAPCAGLPLRDKLLEELHRRWEGLEAASRIRQVTLHYLDGKIEVDIRLPLGAAEGADAAAVAELRRRAEALEDVRRVTILYQ